MKFKRKKYGRGYDTALLNKIMIYAGVSSGMIALSHTQVSKVLKEIEKLQPENINEIKDLNVKVTGLKSGAVKGLLTIISRMSENDLMEGE